MQLTGDLLFATTDFDGLRALDRNAGGTNAWGEVAVLQGGSVFAFAAEGTRLIHTYRDEVFNRRTEVRERHLGGANAWGVVGELVASDGGQLGLEIATSGGRLAVASWSEPAVYLFETEERPVGVRSLGPASQPR